MAQLKNTTVNDIGFIQLPNGTTAQRPTPSAGQMRYNSTIGKIEFYNSVASEWIENRYSGVVADGGIVYDTDLNGTSYRVHAFTTVGSSTFSAKSSGEVEYLIVAGGGGGSGNFYDDGGGGGGGGLIIGTIDVSPQDYTVVVGAGGTWSSGSGGNTSAFGLTALGGGGGGGHRSAGNAGGSGGGGLGSFVSDNRNVDGGAGNQPGSASGGFGNKGGTGGLNGVVVNGGGYPLSGGGGGAGSVGNFPDGVLSIGGAGGYGLNTNISGISTFYAGGGGGVSSGKGGLGGGADASSGRGGSPALIGIPNSGGGGGGGRSSGDPGSPSNGGSGIVIIRYPLHKVPAIPAPKVLNDGLVLDFDLGKASTFKNINESVTDSKKKYTATVVTPVFHGAGSHRNSVVMNGSTGYIDLGSDETFKTTSDWTVETWFKFDVVPDAYNNNTSPGNFIGDESIEYNSWYWSVLEKKLALWNRSPGYWRYGSTEIQPNTWYQSVLVSYPGGTSYRMFLNGSPENGDHVAQVWNAAYSGLRVRYIGRGSSGNPRTFDGNIAITRIYNQALTNQQIEDNFNATRWRFEI